LSEEWTEEPQRAALFNADRILPFKHLYFTKTGSTIYTR